jgi:hypothetical protein
MGGRSVYVMTGASGGWLGLGVSESFASALFWWGEDRCRTLGWPFIGPSLS